MKASWLLLIVIFLLSCKKVPRDDFYLKYSTYNGNYELMGDSLYVTRVQMEFDNPVSAVPSHTTSQTYVRFISSAQIEELKSLIARNGFWQGDRTEYGAPSTERHYPYVLRVRENHREKEIIYRSNPNYEEIPKFVEEISQFLNQLAH